MQFDNAFFATVGLENLDEEKKKDLGEKLSQLAQDKIALVLADRLTDEQLEEFDKIADERGEDAALEYVEGIIPDYQKLIQEQTAEVVQSFMNDMGMLLDYQEQQAQQNPTPQQ